MLSSFVLVILVNHLAAAHPPVILTQDGPVSGVLDHSFNGSTYYGYLGIPFAQPPVGRLRFEEPQTLTSCWLSRKADQYASSCIAYTRANFTQTSLVRRTYKVTGSEDCLYLNVFTNANNLREGNKDVIVYIFGGAFAFGSSHSVQPHAIMDRPGLVYVSIAYRVGIMGFLATGDRVVPGNMGLKDQVAALEWVQRNIASFGGDPKKVTISGISSGAMSVHLMYLSPLTDGLFARGISHSGTALCPRAVLNDIPAKTKHLAAIFNCSTTQSAAMVQCLKALNATDLIAATRLYQAFFYNPVTVFGPTIDYASEKPFLPGPPNDLLRMGKFKKIPWMSSITPGDGLSTAAEYLSRSKPEVLAYINLNWNKLMPMILSYQTTVPCQLLNRVSANLKEAFFSNESLTQENIPNYVDMITDREFAGPAVQSAALMTTHGSDVYFRVFRYRALNTASQTSSDLPSQFGVGHADDTYYVYDSPLVPMRCTPEERTLGQQLLDIEVAFAKTGGLPKSLIWLPFRNDSGSYRYLEINGPGDFKMVQKPGIGRTQEFEKLFASESYCQNASCSVDGYPKP